MNASKLLYWMAFYLLFFLASFLIFKKYQNIGIIILLILGSFHIIIFHIAENTFIDIRMGVGRVVDSMVRAVVIFCKIVFMVMSKSNIVIIDTIAIKLIAIVLDVALSIIAIGVIGCMFIIKKLYKPLKTLEER